MSLEDLKRMGLLRDGEAAPGPPASRVHLPLMILTALVAVAGCVTTVLGGGGGLTWLGIAAFVAGLFGFIGVNLRGVR